MRGVTPPFIGAPAPAGERERRITAAGAVLVVLVVVCSFPWRDAFVGVVPNFLAAYGTLLVLTELATSALLLWRAQSTGDRRIGIAAAAYAFSTPIIAANVLTLPGVAAPNGAFPFQVPPSLWVIWHAGWASILALYAWRTSALHLRSGSRVGGAVGIAAVAIVAVLLTGNALPPLLAADGVYTPLLRACYVGIGVAQLVALAGLARRFGDATGLDCAIAVALVASAGDVFMVASSSVRFALGTYEARALAATAGLVVLGVLVDEYARAMRRSDTIDRYLPLANASPNLVYLSDLRGACTYVNRRWTEVTGQTQRGALGSGWLAVIHPDDVASLPPANPAQLDVRIRGVDGSYRWHQLRAAAIGGTGAEPVAYVGTAVDIHDERVAVQAAREREAAFRAMAAAIPQLVWTADAEGFIDWYNERWYDYTGQTAADAEGWGWQTVHHPDDLPRVMEKWPEAIASGEPFEMEFRLRGADGRFRWFLTRAMPIRDAAGRVVRWYGTNTDIDERRRATDALADSFVRERRLAMMLQSAFLPPFLPDVDGVRFDALYRPAIGDAPVGGDWYDAFPLRDGRIAISIGDVAGHGLDAASIMVRVRETIRAAAASLESDPQAVLAFANRALSARDATPLATAIFGIFDPPSSTFTYAIAGHPAPIVRRENGAVDVLEVGGIPLGVEAQAMFPLAVAVLGPGDVLVLYTDGLIESTRDAIAGEARVRAVLAGDALDAAALVEQTLDGGSLHDDVAVLTLSIARDAGGADWRFRTDDAESARLARPAFVAHLRRRGIAEAVIASAELVFGELVGNVVRHAPGPIEVVVSGEDVLQLTVRDRGAGFMSAAAALPDDLLAEGGRGLFLIRAYAGEAQVRARDGGGSEVTVALHAATLAGANA